MTKSTKNAAKTSKASKATATKPADPNLVPLNKAMKKTAATKEKGLSGLDAAAQVLKAAAEPMRCKEMVARMLSKGLWKTEGKTPAATIYAAILREIQTKGKEARFKKTDRGMFALNK